MSIPASVASAGSHAVASPGSIQTTASGSSQADADTLLAWLVLVLLVFVGASLIPLAARLVRRWLPVSRREPIELPPIVFGHSPQARRSPRHAVRQHRTLMTTGFILVLSLIVLTGIAALQQLGLAGLQVTIGLALPTLLVALHARQRNLQR